MRQREVMAALAGAVASAQATRAQQPKSSRVATGAVS